jgi:beta-ribofuranosylaminobenzene 5'-phosphate synthase
VEHHSYGIYHYMNLMREAGLEFVGMSSVGPSIAVVTKQDRTALEKLIQPMGLSVAISTRVDNTGLSITRTKG